MKLQKVIILMGLMTGCSLFGIQTEETPRHKVLVKEGVFEIREYSAYIIAKTTVKGKSNSSKAFRILAGYIFGKNQSKTQIAMTSPVEMQSEQIAMTAPVEINQAQDQMTMSFSMPSKYTLETLPKPNDENIQLERVDSKIVASIQFSGLRNDKTIEKRQKELRKWLTQYPQYRVDSSHSYAGYNPPWTIPFLRRNEVHIRLFKD